MISKEEIIEKVGVLLKELTDKFEYISSSGKEVHPLEFQLFEINAAYFAEHTNLLRKFEEEEARSRTEAEAPAEAYAPAVEEAEHTQLTDGGPQFIADEEEKEPSSYEEPEPEEERKDPIIEERKDPIIFTPVSSHEPIEEEARDSQETVEEITEQNNSSGNRENAVSSSGQEKSVQKEEPVSEPAREVIHEVVIEEKTLNVPNERPMSLNDRLSEQRKVMDAEKKHLDPPRRIKDIKSGINLNDKLLFIKDLFNGYSLAYSEAIELLNRFETFDDADRFLTTNYAQKNNWETKQATVEKLYAILRQRYG